jgi:multidrug efflux system membrane fusion protein
MRPAIFVLAAGLAFSSALTRADDSPKGWTFTGRTQAAAVDVRARVTGHLTRLAVREGDAVKKGDLLAEIDPRAYQLALDVARARQQVAEARLEAARLKAANAKKLVQNKVVGKDDLALNMAAEAEAQAALMGAKVEVERAKMTLSWTRVTAPFSGRVSRIQSTEGGLVTADQTHILRVVATGPLHVTFSVPEAIFLQLRRDGLSEPGKLDVAVGFALDEGYPHAAKLDLVEPEVDPKTATVRFRATLANPKGVLLPGMSARVHLTPPRK